MVTLFSCDVDASSYKKMRKSIKIFHLFEALCVFNFPGVRMSFCVVACVNGALLPPDNN